MFHPWICSRDRLCLWGPRKLGNLFYLSECFSEVSWRHQELISRTLNLWLLCRCLEPCRWHLLHLILRQRPPLAWIESCASSRLGVFPYFPFAWARCVSSSLLSSHYGTEWPDYTHCSAGHMALGWDKTFTHPKFLCFALHSISSVSALSQGTVGVVDAFRAWLFWQDAWQFDHFQWRYCTFFLSISFIN